MGYYCRRDVASIVEPSEIALANNPNFVVFSSQESTEPKQHSITSLKVVSVGARKANLSIEITEKQSGDVHIFRSTYDPKQVNNKTFLIVSNSTQLTGDDSGFLDGIPLVLTAQNVKNCLMKNSFLRNNFEITMDIAQILTEAETFDKYLYEDNSITIKSKGYGPQYDFSVAVKYDAITAVESDYSISLKNLDYSDLDASTLQLNLNGHSLRVAIDAYFYGDLEKNDENYFKVVFPTEGRSEDEARLETLKNLKACMFREKMAYTNLSIYLNVEELRIDCSYADRNPACVLDDIISSTILVEKGNTIDYVKISTSKIAETTATDTIDYGTGCYQIELDVYTDHQVFPGTDDGLRMGSYMTTLSKSYFGKTLWFDLSTLLSKKVTYSSAFLTELELDEKDKNFRLWSNANTMTDYRFIARRTDGAIHQPFYYSSPLYVLNGYNYTLNPMNLEKDEDGNSYMLDFSQKFFSDKFIKVKPLTTNFSRTHIKGQRQYFNYIHKYHWTTIRVAGADNLAPSIALHYKLYTQSGALIGKYTEKGQEENNFGKVNTALLQLDRFLPMYKNKTVGRIDVYLCTWHRSEYLGIDEPEVIISTPITFRILPEVLNNVNDFAFLNQLGGWDTMNFGGSSSSEFKTASTTIYKTLQPGFTLQSEIESIATQTTHEQKVAQTSPLTKETVQWLQQMSASPAVYELSTKRYILIDDMSLKYNSTDDLYQVEMKYHYADVFK